MLSGFVHRAALFLFWAAKCKDRLIFKYGGYREMISEIKAKEEAEKRAAARKVKEERRRSKERENKKQGKVADKKKSINYHFPIEILREI